ncbi:hypothetical protein MSG28_003649 [Choristoneura fumiferana]|uniref:Uncharacterized protein n=1 Tax=Choristoneura fumiferana TaxID=7141 RepID=A0ACC0KG32_CHOFU|nr:hypothetical protein MSG28_003649 [Choristoneura fumiferana]
MEVGAVKQAFNNEIIHKLTRKAKMFTEKKAPEKLKLKLKRKAESAVNEVLIIKKIKPKVLAKFAVTHTGNLHDYLNRPIVDQDKACARLLLHKSLQEKYNYIRKTFSNISISDLLMSRLERRKMKKEALEKQKMKRDKKQKVVNAEEEDEASGDDDDVNFEAEGDSEEERAHSDDEDINNEEKSGSEIEEQNNDSDKEVEEQMEFDEETDDEKDFSEEVSDEDGDKSSDKFIPHQENDDEEGDERIVKEDVKPEINTNNKLSTNTNIAVAQARNNNKPAIKKPTKPRDANKNKKLNEKLISRNFKKGSSETHVSETKVVDPFFITATGENYMSVAEPRQPDEVKEIHKQGNRKLRRAAMFGHVPKIKPRQEFREGNYNRQNDSQAFRNKSYGGDGNYSNNRNSKFNDRNNSQFRGRDDRQFEGRNDQLRGDDSQYKGNRNDSKFKGKNASFSGRNDDLAPKVEKLHPSWEAKKKKSGIQPFQDNQQ